MRKRKKVQKVDGLFRAAVDWITLGGQDTWCKDHPAIICQHDLAAFARSILEAQAAAFEAEAATIDAGTMAGAKSVLLQAARACRDRAGGSKTLRPSGNVGKR